MRGEFLRAKASFMIMVTVASIFTIYLASPVSGQEMTGCCEEAKDTGESCVMTTESQCDSPNFSPTSCDQTGYCKNGCCVSLDGVCSVNVARGKCESLEGYMWLDNANCDLAQCQKGCCVLGGAQCFYTTEKKCKQTTAEYEALELDFRSAVGTEFDCLDICKQQDEGCCVSEEATGIYTTRGNCPTRGYDPSTGIGFFKDTFCSNENLDTGCKAHDHQDCLEGREKVYWFDSCGNREEIVTETIEGSQNAAQNGDCEYATGTLCGHDDNGKAICKDLNCATTYEDTEINYVYDGQPRSNGESWCMYDSKSGIAADPVGSRHYRHMCINGEESVVPCEDARQEICKNGVVTDVPESFSENGEILEAACVLNKWEVCVTQCNTLGDLDATNSFGDATGAMKSASRKDETCCNRNNFDCYWQWIEKNEIGRCYPLVPPGGKFWLGPTSSINKEPTCEIASNEFLPLWQQSVALIGDYECSEGCEVYTGDFLKMQGMYCASLGDCGANYNYQGKWTNDGLTRTWDKEEEIGKKIELGGKEYPITRTLVDPDNWEERMNAGEGVLAYKIPWGTMKDLAAEGSGSVELWLAGIAGGVPAAGALVMGGTLLALRLGEFSGSMLALAASAKVGVGHATMSTVMAESWFGSTSASLHSVGIIVSWAMMAIGVFLIFGGALGWGRGVAITGAITLTSGVASLITYTCLTSCWSAWGIAAVAAVAVLGWVSILAADSEERMVTIQCTPWQPPTEEYDCESCDADPWKPCSEYRCKAIGQNCAFIAENEGTNRKTCYNANPDDVTSPKVIDKSAKIISHGEDITISGNYQVIPTETSTQVTGFKITPNVPPYSRVVLEVETNELSQCKIGTELPQGAEPYTVLPNYMPDSYYDVKHNYTIAGVIPEKEYHYYIACQDPSGNPMPVVYGVQFTVDQGNDLTPPQILGATLKDNAYIAAGTEEMIVGIYVDEQSRLQCKWSTEDKDFGFMENNMSCASVPMEALNSRPAECATKLTLGEKLSRFYFRCKDYPLEYAGGRPTGNVLSSNVMQQSFKLNLQKTEPLIIQQTAPEGKLYTNKVTMQVNTQVGAENGKARCYYNDIEFLYPDENYYSYHEQAQGPLPTGDYKYDIECVDIAGNIALGNITFSVDVDTAAPNVVGIYKSGSELRIQTDETSTCEYSNSTFIYGYGTKMTPGNSLTHSTTASMPRYHVICADTFNNRMPEVKIILFESIS